MDYYAKREAKVNLYHALRSEGWKCYGYKNDQSDMMTDYWSPADWDGIAEKNGYVLLIDQYGTGNSGKEIKETSYQLNYKKVSKLEALINDKGATEGEKQAAQQQLNRLYQKEKESIKVIETWPTFSHKTPKMCTWHIEKDGAIIAKGKGLNACYASNDHHEEVKDKLNKNIAKFIARLEKAIADNTALKAETVKEKVKVLKFIPISLNISDFKKDVTYIQLNASYTGGHYKGNKYLLKEVYQLKNGSKNYTFVKLGRRNQPLKMYGAANNTLTLGEKTLLRGIQEESILTVELKEVTEVKEKTVYKKVKKQEETPKQPQQADSTLTGETAPEAKKESQNENKAVKNDITASYTLNEEKNGIEIYFTDKPDEETRNQLKENGFRFFFKKKAWIAKQNEERLQFVKALTNEEDKQEENQTNEAEQVTEQPETKELTLQEAYQQHESFITSLVENRGINNAIRLTDLKGYIANIQAAHEAIKENAPAFINANDLIKSVNILKDSPIVIEILEQHQTEQPTPEPTNDTTNKEETEQNASCIGESLADELTDILTNNNITLSNITPEQQTAVNMLLLNQIKKYNYIITNDVIEYLENEGYTALKDILLSLSATPEQENKQPQEVPEQQEILFYNEELTEAQNVQINELLNRHKETNRFKFLAVYKRLNEAAQAVIKFESLDDSLKEDDRIFYTSILQDGSTAFTSRVLNDYYNQIKLIHDFTTVKQQEAPKTIEQLRKEIQELEIKISEKYDMFVRSSHSRSATPLKEITELRTRQNELKQQLRALRQQEQDQKEHNSTCEKSQTSQETEPEATTSKVLDFTNRFQQKKQKQEQQELFSHFQENILPYLSHNERIELMEASKDKEKFNDILSRLLVQTPFRAAEQQLKNK